MACAVLSLELEMSFLHLLIIYWHRNMSKAKTDSKNLTFIFLNLTVQYILCNLLNWATF